MFEIWAKSGPPFESFADVFKDERLSHRVTPIIDAFIVNPYTDQANSAKAYGLLKKDVDFDSWFEPKNLKRALADLKLDHFWSTYDVNGKPVSEGEIEHTKAVSN